MPDPDDAVAAEIAIRREDVDRVAGSLDDWRACVTAHAAYVRDVRVWHPADADAERS